MRHRALYRDGGIIVKNSLRLPCPKRTRLTLRSRAQETFQPELILGTRAEKGTTGEDERQYASLIGSMVEPILVSLFDSSTKIAPITTDFVSAYVELVHQADDTFFLHTLTSTQTLLEQYAKNDWVGYTTTDIPASLKSRGVTRLPTNRALRTILIEMDHYMADLSPNSFLGAYQSNALAHENNHIHPFGRFLINGILVVARELIAHAPNKDELMQFVRKFERFETQNIISGTQRLQRNVKLMNGSGKPYLLQLDAVRTDDQDLYKGQPLTTFPERGDDCITFLSTPHPWDLVNIKMVGDNRSLSGRTPLAKVRAVDEKQLYGQLTKLIYTLYSIHKIEKINFPQSAVFVYARPCRPLRILEIPIDAAFFSRFFDYLDDLFATNRIDPALHEPLKKVLLIVVHEAATHDDKKILLPQHELPEDTRPIDHVAAMQNFLNEAAISQNLPLSIVTSEKQKWDRVLYEQRSKKRRKSRS